LQHELGFELNNTWDFKFVWPFALWPHIEFYQRDWSPTFLAAFKGSPYKNYNPADLALLEDPAKCALYIEAHTVCIAPRWCEVAIILSIRSTLMEPPPATTRPTGSRCRVDRDAVRGIYRRGIYRVDDE
jgi:hypothetical protein